MGNLSRIEQRERGITQVLLMRLNSERLPFAQRLKKKVDRGELLSDYDLRVLEQAIASSGEVRRLVEKHPQYQDLAARMMTLYSDILHKHEENLQQGSPRA